MTALTQGGAVTWTINRFYVTEPATAETPAEIIPLNSPFDVSVEFDGSGGAWAALESANAAFQVKFYAEGIGDNARELDLGVYAGNLGAGPYIATLNVSGIDTEGVYRLGCLVLISPPSGVLGFDENLLIAVN